jgi:hypothetical protein
LLSPHVTPRGGSGEGAERSWPTLFGIDAAGVVEAGFVVLEADAGGCEGASEKEEGVEEVEAAAKEIVLFDRDDTTDFVIREVDGDEGITAAKVAVADEVWGTNVGNTSDGETETADDDEGAGDANEGANGTDNAVGDEADIDNDDTGNNVVGDETDMEAET